MIKVQQENFDVSAELAALTSGNHAIGGIASYVGLVRDLVGADSPDDALRAMTLEHYPGMTEKKLAAIETEAQSRWPLEASLIVHRYGRLEPGEQIVLVACASAHRQAALDACNFLMDWLKTEAPFWKLEETGAGEAWVDSRASDDAAAARWKVKTDRAAE
ncbi:MAG: molybdenum cofactor biosynthesis protein MoaE [Alphaproteobacteria bacterium]|nr:molybdenum cofactor biosynthesis protein MoaE [Alphaproteobacteria bacterium]